MLRSLRNCLFLLLPLVLPGIAADPSLESIYRGFQNPSPEYSVSPYWFWNGKVTAAESRRQIGEMVKQGVHSAVVFNWAGLEPPFLSDAWWQEVGAALDAAKAAGLSLNFADEFLWPSGQAWDNASLNPERSRVLQAHPEFRMRRLAVRQVDSAANVPNTAMEAIVAAHISDSGEIDEQSLTLLTPARLKEWTSPGSGWKLFVYTPVAAEERGVRVDLLNPAAVRTFIDLVYSEFAKRFPRHLSTTIKFFVSDHEGSYGAPLPFTPALWETFQKHHGYDLRRYLPMIERDGAKAATVRQDYLNTISHLYATSFVQQVTDWCTAHGVKHGHSDIEETLYLQTLWTGDMFRLWRASSAIFIDALIERSRMPVDFQEAISVAHFENRPLMVENQGLIGHDSYWSLEKARAGSNMCLLWGANRLIPHYFEYDQAHVQYPPSWFLAQPLWRYFKHYADVVRRGQYMNAQGRHNAGIAIYAPIESGFANAGKVFRENRSQYDWNNSMDGTQDYYSALQLELSRGGWDYHIVDRHYLARAEQTGAKLNLAGEEFTVLILPPMTHIEQESAARIRRFAAAGGIVIALGQQPSALDGAALRHFPVGNHPHFMSRLSYTERIEAPPGVVADLAPVLRLIDTVHPPEVEILSGKADNLYFSKRGTSDTQWYWTVNDSPDARTVTARFSSTGVFEKWDAETGGRSTLRASGSEVTLSFGPWDAFFVVRHSGASTAPVARPAQSVRRVLLNLPRDGWQFTPESEIRVPYANVQGSEEPVWLAPERLANRSWWLAGPYPDVEHHGLSDVFPPERGFDAGDPAWKWFESPTSAVRLQARGVQYAYVNVWSPEARRAQVAIAIADSVKVWWNGKLELAAHLHPPFVNLRDPWSYCAPIEIRKGWNSVLIKMAAAAAGRNGFLFRITDAAGATLRDLEYTRDRTIPERNPRMVHLSVDAPSGTRGKSLSYEVEQGAIPERPFVFAPATSPFTLGSWSDSTLANYSGTALYDIDFTLAVLPTGERIWLDLGAVGLAAEVWLNGRKSGERTWRPFELDVSEYVRSGLNHLRVRVANSNAGWMAQGDPVYERGAWGVNFSSERDRIRTLHPNGLEGPVRLLAETP